MLRHRFLAALVPVALVVSACGDDDGADVRNIGDECGWPRPRPAPRPARPPGPPPAGRPGPPADRPLAGRRRAPRAAAQRQRHRRRGRGLETDNPLVEAAVDRVQDYVDEQVDATIAATTTFTDAVRAGDLDGGQGGLRPVPPGLGAHRADRRPGRGDRRHGRRPRRRLRGRATTPVHRLAPHRVPPVGAGHDRGRGRLRRPARRRPPDAQDRAGRASRSRRRPWPSARPSSSRRSPPARSPARRTATRAPTCGTSPPTSRAPRRRFDLLDPRARGGRPRAGRRDRGPVRRDRRPARPSTRTAPGYQPYSALTEADKTAMQTTLADLSENLAPVAGVLGLESERRVSGVSRRFLAGRARVARPPWPGCAAAAAASRRRRRRRRRRRAPAEPARPRSTSTSRAPPDRHHAPRQRARPAGRVHRHGDDRDRAARHVLPPSPTRSRRLMAGEPYDDRDPAYPPLHTGTVGNPPPPADLSVVVSVGASLFDDRFGLADRRPRRSRRCRSSPTTGSIPARSHGDVLLTHHQRPRGRQPVRPAPAHRATRGHAGAALDARRLQPPHRGRPGRGRRAQPHGLHRRDGQPRPRRRPGDGPLRVDPGRRRRAGLGRGRQLPRRAGHPHVRRVLGPHPPRPSRRP